MPDVRAVCLLLYVIGAQRFLRSDGPEVGWVPIEPVIENVRKGFADLPVKPSCCGFFESLLLEFGGTEVAVRNSPICRRCNEQIRHD